MNILGISAFYHDSAACLIQDGKVTAAAQEERFTRKKHDFNFPENAIQYCLTEGGISKKEIDYVAFYDKPFIKFERLILTYLAYAPRGLKSFIKAMPLWLNQKLWIKSLIADKLDFEGKILFPEHHESHAASAFFPSPYEEAAILTIDGVGEWTTTSYGVGKGNHIELLGDLHFPHSLGLLYSAFTYFTGFRVNSGEYKLMGLAPYGEPKYVDIIMNELIDLKDDGSFKMDMRYFNYCAGLTMTNDRLAKLFGGPARKPETKISQREMDIASSIQVVTEEIMLRMARHVQKETGMKHLVLAGGVALNCVGNGRILRDGPFEDIWIQPAAGDAGGALGAASYTWHQYLGNKRTVRKNDPSQRTPYLGPEFSDDEVLAYLKKEDIVFQKLSVKEMAEKVAGVIADGNVVGWFQGRMEFGPRALGNRSIIGDARSPKMQSVMNLKIKYRESFRPFAPSIIKENASDYFELEGESPYMLIVAPVKKEHHVEVSQNGHHGLDKLKVARSSIPAVTHVDYSARIQTVKETDNPRYYATIKAFREKTGCPTIINTSFNVRGEPIVCTPEQAYLCFLRTNMDYLVVGNYLMDKKKQKKLKSDIDWQKEYELD